MRSEGELILGQWKMCPVELAYEGGAGRRQDWERVSAKGSRGDQSSGEEPADVGDRLARGIEMIG